MVYEEPVPDAGIAGCGVMNSEESQRRLTMARKKSTSKKTSIKKTATRKSSPPKDESTNLERVFDENVKLLARSSEVALKAYIEVVKSVTNPRTAQAGTRLVEQVAEAWKAAMLETNRLLRNTYSSLDKQIKLPR
ncbi:MAG: hypothetical protein ACREQH_12330 [Candidatus Binatus sp.]